ncbi:hypothetical protein D3C86_2079270 [compost metagenome]
MGGIISTYGGSYAPAILFFHKIDDIHNIGQYDTLTVTWYLLFLPIDLEGPNQSE